MAARVLDAGVGVHLSKSSFTADSLLDSLTTLLSPALESRYAASLQKARDAMVLSGGVDRAVNFIEFVAEHGVGALLPVDVSHPWYVRHHLDSTLIHALLGLITFVFWRWLCCSVRPGKECVSKRNKPRKPGNHNAADSSEDEGEEMRPAARKKKQ